MAQAMLEHVNITVSDGARAAEMLCAVFGWRVRWQGQAKSGGYSRHVGTEDQYVVVYTPPMTDPGEEPPKRMPMGRLNHVGVVVPDLQAAERRVLEAGLRPFNHGDYEPGRRFYFLDADGIEYEVVSYG